MARYRKKPVEVDAWVWDGTFEAVSEIAKAGLRIDPLIPPTEDHKLPIQTLEGTMTASLGDYIIRGVQGEFYPCKPDIFEATYERV